MDVLHIIQGCFCTWQI